MCLSFVHSHTHTLNTFKWLAATFHLIVERKHFYECLTRKLYLPSMHFHWQHKTISIVEMSWKWKRNSFKIIHSMNIGMLQKNIQNKLFDIIVTAMFTEYFFTLLLVCNEWWVYGTKSKIDKHTVLFLMLCRRNISLMTFFARAFNVNAEWMWSMKNNR